MESRCISYIRHGQKQHLTDHKVATRDSDDGKVLVTNLHVGNIRNYHLEGTETT